MDSALPSKLKNLDGIYGKWSAAEIIKRVNTLTESEKAEIEKLNITAWFCYVYSLTIWDQIDNICGLRQGYHVLYGGIQMAVNNMPQGERIQIPLTKNIGRQKQANILLHFENCEADMGRKGFDKSIVDLAKTLSRKIVDGPIQIAKKCLKTNSGAAPDLARDFQISSWKKEMIQHETESPLVINNPNFFNPINEVAVLSTPTREQDVIALFNQLIAGGVIRGIKIMSTNERSTYDGLFRIVVKEGDIQKFDKATNPLGITEKTLKDILGGMTEKISEPKILEYKFSLDGLIEDFEDGTKNLNDIDLVIAWESGTQYKENYRISSLLIDDEQDMRQYHGITHDLFSVDGQHICFVILLKDLIMRLNNSPEFSELQQTYEE